MESARRIQRAVAAPSAKGWNRLPHGRPRLVTFAPDQSGSARSEDPLVTAGHEEVAAQLCDWRILDAESVNAVHAQQHPLRRVASCVEIADDVGDASDG